MSSIVGRLGVWDFVVAFFGSSDAVAMSLALVLTLSI